MLIKSHFTLKSYTHIKNACVLQGLWGGGAPSTLQQQAHSLQHTVAELRTLGMGLSLLRVLDIPGKVRSAVKWALKEINAYFLYISN